MNYCTTFYALGTQNSIIVENMNAVCAVTNVIERVNEIEEKMSPFIYSSEISKLARNSGISPIKVSEDVFYVLEKAVEFSFLSNGAFDITVRPFTELWDFGRGNDIIPNSTDINNAKVRVGFKYLQLNAKDKTAFLSKTGGSVDLGGIAKGYAADEAKRILIEHGIKKAIINFGGNVVAIGSSFSDSPWKVGIQNPLSVRGDSVLSIDISDISVVTSAVNERFFIKNGVRYHHIISPLTGCPAQSGLLSVTVINKSSILADALSTAVFVLGKEDGINLIRKFNSDAVFITENGDIYSTFKTASNHD